MIPGIYNFNLTIITFQTIEKSLPWAKNIVVDYPGAGWFGDSLLIINHIAGTGREHYIHWFDLGMIYLFMLDMNRWYPELKFLAPTPHYFQHNNWMKLFENTPHRIHEFPLWQVCSAVRVVTDRHTHRQTNRLCQNYYTRDVTDVGCKKGHFIKQGKHKFVLKFNFRLCRQ